MKTYPIFEKSNYTLHKYNLKISKDMLNFTDIGMQIIK